MCERAMGAEVWKSAHRVGAAEQESVLGKNADSLVGGRRPARHTSKGGCGSHVRPESRPAGSTSNGDVKCTSRHGWMELGVGVFLILC